MKWLKYTRGTIPINRFDIFAQGLFNIPDNIKGKPFYNVRYINIGDKVWFFWLKKEIVDYGNYLIKKCHDRSRCNKHIKNLEKLCKDGIKSAEKISKMNLSRLNTKELASLFEYAYEEFNIPFNIPGFDIDSVDIVFEDYFSDLVSKELEKRNVKNIDKIIKELSVPAEQTYLNRQEIDIMKVAQKKNITNSDIENLYNKYWWTDLGWEQITPHTIKSFQTQINKHKQDKELRKKLDNLQKQIKIIKARRLRLIKKYKLSKNIVHWLNFVDKYTYLHDLRKESQVKMMYANYLLVKEVGRRINVKASDLEWFTNDEIVRFLRGNKFRPGDLKERKIAIGYEIDKNNIKLFKGSKAIKLKNDTLKEEKYDTKIIKGKTAQAGFVKGRVKVCKGAVEVLKKIKKGDILVCGMTTPEYVPAMKKAKAIITDEGGITCHAAIISREIKTPCIVGAQIATEVLKDGDRVEVDANQGIIKIL